MLTLDTELQYKKSQYESLYSMRIKNLESAGVRPSSFQSFDIGYTSRSQWSHSHDIWRLTVAVGNVGVRSSELICLESVSEKWIQNKTLLTLDINYIAIQPTWRVPETDQKKS